MALIAALSFTSPAMLAGTMAVAVPILAHLLNRRTRRRIVFPTVRLLRESAASQSRLFRMRRWILLALRCLAILLVVWAFARPVWLRPGMPSLAPGRGAAVVLVLDTSASSAQQAGGVSLVDSMRAVAGRVINALEEGADQLNIVYASGRPEPAFPQLTHNLAAIRQELKGLRPSHERADLPEAIAVAGRLIEKQGGAGRVVVLSDMQRTNWSEVGLTTGSSRLLPAGTQVTVRPIGQAVPVNAALSEPRAVPVQPIVGQPMQLLVHVSNYAEHARRVEVTASVDGDSLGVETVTLEPWEGVDIAFDTKLGITGPHQVVFSLPPDSLAADNHAFALVRAVRRVPVVVVGDDNPDEPGTSTYFLTRALAPRGDLGDDLAVRHLTSVDLSYPRIAAAESVFIGYVGKLSTTALKALHLYVNQGGGAVFFCGDGPVAENLMALTGLARHSELLPWTPGSRRDPGRDGAFLTITRGDWQCPLFAEFDAAGQHALAQVRFGRVWSVGRLNKAARMLLVYDDGTPALASHTIGGGRFLVANFSPALSSSDFGKYGSFVALVQSLVYYLRPGRPMGQDALVGEPFTRSVAVPNTAKRLSVIGPDERNVANDLARQGEQVVVDVSRPRLPGFYHIVLAEKAVATTAVNLDPRESDLRRIDKDVLFEHLRNDQVAVNIVGRDEQGPILQLRGRPLWPWSVMAVMCVVGLELALLAVWRR